MIDLLQYGLIPTMVPENAKGIPARVLAVHRERYQIVCSHGICSARLKAGIYYKTGLESFPTTGDFVLIDYISNGESLILSTLERKTYFSRRDPSPGRGEQAVAANFDYVFIMQSLNHDLNEKRLERYLTLAWQSGAVPVILLTKRDLAEDWQQQQRQVEMAASGVGVYAISSQTGEGLKELKPYLKPQKTIVFLGSSGVGKSSLVNALSGEEVMYVQEIREDDSKGRHTTTHRQLLLMENQVMIIDTPGMRELGMWDVTQGLGETFADIEELLGSCRFTNCTHQTEPQCAILQAIAQGTLSQQRWDSYRKLLREAKYSGDKASMLREKQQWHKNISKQLRQIKKKR